MTTIVISSKIMSQVKCFQTHCWTVREPISANYDHKEVLPLPHSAYLYPLKLRPDQPLHTFQTPNRQTVPIPCNRISQNTSIPRTNVNCFFNANHNYQVWRLQSLQVGTGGNVCQVTCSMAVWKNPTIKAEKVSKNIEVSAATDVLYLLQRKSNLQMNPWTVRNRMASWSCQGYLGRLKQRRELQNTQEHLIYRCRSVFCYLSPGYRWRSVCVCVCVCPCVHSIVWH